MHQVIVLNQVDESCAFGPGGFTHFCIRRNGDAFCKSELQRPVIVVNFVFRFACNVWIGLQYSQPVWQWPVFRDNSDWRERIRKIQGFIGNISLTNLSMGDVSRSTVSSRRGCPPKWARTYSLSIRKEQNYFADWVKRTLVCRLKICWEEGVISCLIWIRESVSVPDWVQRPYQRIWPQFVRYCTWLQRTYGP